ARAEFPDLDITFRGAVSIGRRLQDPLSELIKIDPQSIGVGQYQHDVDKKKLKIALDDVVVSCVNLVGVDVNSAGIELLGYVSGLGKTLASSIVKHREKSGLFPLRSSLLEVKGLGKTAWQQAAGFLRIMNGDNPLDSSAVHPENYHVAEKIASDLNLEIGRVMGMSGIASRIDPKNYTDESAGLLTVNDIIAELEKPGRDPRSGFELFSYSAGIEKIEDLSPGMILNGTVTNVTAFGAFVDIGVHQDGLVHKSMISKSFVENPADFIRVNQKVCVKVIEIDRERKRISLSIKDALS
ncbi:MAG: S1 RNA-binding domain-containing protein, partial [Spirochaetia bacterium]|nr:S1 RNA-binding domain-containing protein [Spirochaetia bacterium]